MKEQHNYIFHQYYPHIYEYNKLKTISAHVGGPRGRPDRRDSPEVVVMVLGQLVAG